MRITFLGTGTSHGVPNIDCMLNDHSHCPRGVCLKAATDARYRRTRASVVVETGGPEILIDTSQDFCQQVLSNRVRRIDSVLFTHGHADHIYGLPDIRSYCRHQGGAIDVYGSRETLEILRGAFEYVFDPPAYVGGGIPQLRTHVLDGPAEAFGQQVIPIPVEHGALLGCLGYRLGHVAYIPDVKAIPRDSLALLEDLDLLILDCLRLRPHGSHLCLEESLAYAERLRPRRCLFTHMTHDIDYQVDERLLPEWIRFAHDGQVVEV